jgi:hypothetical protein
VAEDRTGRCGGRRQVGEQAIEAIELGVLAQLGMVELPGQGMSLGAGAKSDAQVGIVTLAASGAPQVYQRALSSGDDSLPLGSGTRQVAPDRETREQDSAVIAPRQAMPARTEVLSNRPERVQEPLRLLR